MRISEGWLRELSNPPASTQEIAERLVMGGLELEIEAAVAELASGVVVARILKAEPHPNADRLRVCSVDIGSGEPISIVCGAANARAGICVPCALPGALLPGGLHIESGVLRGVASAGMLCSAKELALSERSDGLLELDADAPLGLSIADYLKLDDRILHLELTPNRGDCLSVLGLAREVSALYGLPLPSSDALRSVDAVVDAGQVGVESQTDTPALFVQRVDGIRHDAQTPDWMRERLRRSGIRCLHPLVDITNYVMIELGQPLHAYDAARVTLPLTARRARRGERLQLLNEQTVDLTDELLIADSTGPLSLAGVMGGLASAVDAETTSVIFESAAFAPQAVAGVGRRHRIQSDALYRFERGVDRQGQRRALARAVELTLAICGGTPGSCAGVTVDAELPMIRLRQRKLTDLLGIELDEQQVAGLFARLGIEAALQEGEWTARPPSWRNDLAIDVDLIEEVARLYGYDRLPARPYAAELVPQRHSETRRSLAALRTRLAARGWQEIVSLAFADPALQRHLAPELTAVAVDNPLAETLSELRVTLWSGLIEAWRYNRARQADRAWLFEAGHCFWLQPEGTLVEVDRLAGLMAGSSLGEHWAMEKRPFDFYDLKGEVEDLLEGCGGRVEFHPAGRSALHPGRSASITIDGIAAGCLGELHPQLAALLDVPAGCLLFELEVPAISRAKLPTAAKVPEFPSSRRDLAVVVGSQVSAEALVAACRNANEPLLSDVWVFDVYTGPGLAEACKSMTLGLIFQDCSRTLTVVDVDAAVERLRSTLHQAVGATVR